MAPPRARALQARWEYVDEQLPHHHSVEDDELRVLGEAVSSGRATLFEDRHQVADGIEVIRVGGHTPGQAVVLVRTADGPVLLASDAVHYYEECDKDMPFMSVANLVDMYAGFDTIRSNGSHSAAA